MDLRVQDVLIIKKLMEYGQSFPNMTMFMHHNREYCTAAEFRAEMLFGPSDTWKEDFIQRLGIDPSQVPKFAKIMSDFDKDRDLRYHILNLRFMVYLWKRQREHITNIKEMNLPDSLTTVTEWKFRVAKELLEPEKK